MTNNKKRLNNFKEKIAFKLLPHKRNQDIVEIGKYSVKKGGEIFFASIVDGWNNPNEMSDDSFGRIVAERVSKEFPHLFLQLLEEDSFKLDNISKIAKETAQKMDKEVISWYPAHASCVGSFIFELPEYTIIVAQGTISTLLWNGKAWEKPEEIGDYILDPKRYESGSRTFFGRGELKNNPFYTADTDTLVVSNDTPILVATDGLILEKKMMNLEELNNLSQRSPFLDPETFIDKLGAYIESRRHLQKDDISIFIKVPRTK